MTDSVNEAPEPFQTLREARALIGWMHPKEAALTLAGRRHDRANSPSFFQRAEKARLAVAARPTRLRENDIVADAPASLDGHIDELRRHSVASQYFAEGWSVKMADLRSVCAMQPTVFSDSAKERVQGVAEADIEAIARVTLPLAPPAKLPAQFDESRKTWIFSAANPNLRIVGHFSAPAQPGIVAFGFAVSISSSFVQVASYQGRALLRDGYHRCVGLLSRGITHTPVFFREAATFDELAMPPGCSRKTPSSVRDRRRLPITSTKPSRWK